jgi:hypothetical protein
VRQDRPGPGPGPGPVDGRGGGLAPVAQCWWQHDRAAARCSNASRCGGAWTRMIRVRVEIMGAPICRNVGESESVLIMIDLIISPRTRICLLCRCASVLTGISLVRRVGRATKVKCMADRRCAAPAFTVMRRRHHCRGCGQIFCDRCCPERALVGRGLAPKEGVVVRETAAAIEAPCLRSTRGLPAPFTPTTPSPTTVDGRDSNSATARPRGLRRCTTGRCDLVGRGWPLPAPPPPASPAPVMALAEARSRRHSSRSTTCAAAASRACRTSRAMAAARSGTGCASCCRPWPWRPPAQRGGRWPRRWVLNCPPSPER